MQFKTKKATGSVLTIILIVVVLMGISLGSYMKLVASQNLSVQRSQNWNSSIAVAEAGVEEAMAHLNKNTTNRTKDSWTLDLTNVVKSRALDADNKYKVFITTLAEPPIIFVQGSVHVPKSDKWITRTIKAGTTNDGFFVKAMVAKGQIDLKGNRITVDSFDSQDPAKSIAGKYDPSKRGDKGDVATNSKIIDSLSTGNADIWGHIATGPGGSATSLPNGSIGDLAWHAAGKTGLETNFFKNDMNVQFPDVQPPFTWGTKATPLPGVYPLIGGIAYDILMVGSPGLVTDFNLDNINLSGSKKILVTGGPVRLYVKNDVSMTGSSQLIVDTTASLQMFVAGANAEIGGKGVLNNNGSAVNFSYYGLNSNTSVKYTGNASFLGSLYAPYADLTMGGGGSGTPIDFVGSSISKTVTMNGKFNFHYDEALGRKGARRGYTVTSWNEIAKFP
jgi:hypothetical protein